MDKIGLARIDDRLIHGQVIRNRCRGRGERKRGNS